ncbi:MAG TPA: BON domain-containing protein [Vicinamibacterales bacterium]|nr:BON domain-containing protein [Vicinamibacterales bacterium]
MSGGEWAVRWRHDGQLARAVVSALERSAVVPEGKIWVAVRDGQVTLKGQVDSDRQRAAAVTLAHDLTGVRRVVDSITVAERALSAAGAATALHSS